LPTILCEINDSNGSITNKYYYANAQILTQYDCNGLDEVLAMFNPESETTYDHLQRITKAECGSVVKSGCQLSIIGYQ